MVIYKRQHLTSVPEIPLRDLPIPQYLLNPFFGSYQRSPYEISRYFGTRDPLTRSPDTLEILGILYILLDTVSDSPSQLICAFYLCQIKTERGSSQQFNIYTVLWKSLGAARVRTHDHRIGIRFRASALDHQATAVTNIGTPWRVLYTLRYFFSRRLNRGP